MSLFTLRQLQVFEAVAAAGSVSRAAELLELTQPAVSMQMRQLEADLGLPLFERQGKTRQLSDVGRELLAHARVIHAQVRATEDSLSTWRSGSRGTLHVGVVSPAHYFAPWLLAAFRRTHPEVRLKLSVESRDTLLDMLQEHRLDLAIAGYPPSEADVEAETFARHPHCIVAAADHPLAGQQRITWQDIRSEPFIFREAGSTTRQFLEHLLQAQSIQVDVSLELSGNETIKQAVEAGLGISFLSAHTFQTEVEARRLCILDVVDMPKMLDWCVLHRRNETLDGLAASFKSFVIAEGASLVRVRSDALYH